ncbi:DsbA family oxidoreductase [Albibacillus kandeliae]|uniref:DsbA family oxidoreductase n=1 Tax=Albibacillus kandeliae TaxID=2174228 RepID=UPI000D69AFA8|nr:DsbA family oxidoreductase [Albibacillus kandeliae]
MAQSAPPVRVDIVSDVVCPWCIIGYRQLLQAQELSGIEAEIRWHPFELNPDMPDEGQDMREHIAQKYGSTPEQSQSSRDRITALGADLGFDFRFTPEMRMWNTFRAHQLLDWAEEDGHQTALKEALFAAHFTEGRDVSDPGVLVEVAAEAGLDPARARDVLESGSHASRTRSKQRFWIERGVSGVPAMVFAGRYLVTGAQGPDTYAGLLRRCQSEAA